MVDTKRPGSQFQTLMMGENIAVGRTWAALPTYIRVTVGTRDEMQKFQSAFIKCMDHSPDSARGSASIHMPAFHIPTELYRGEMHG